MLCALLQCLCAHPQKWAQNNLIFLIAQESGYAFRGQISIGSTELIIGNKNLKSLSFTKEADLCATACSVGIRFKRYFF